jgi:hypothetical protein
VFDLGDGLDRMEAWVARELRRPVATNAARKARIMELVRATVPPARRARLPRPGRGTRAGWASPIIGGALAAGVCGVMTAAALRPLLVEPGPASAVSADADAALADTVASTLRDTVRLMRSILAAPAHSGVVAAADFTRWNASATSVAAADASAVSMVAVALAPGRHRAAFTDGAHLVPEPPTLRAPGAGSPAHSADSLVPASDTSS